MSTNGQVRSRTAFALAPALLMLVAIVAGYFLGVSYIGRLSEHRGYWLVPVEDEVRAPAPPRPRVAVVIVVDGLRRDAAETMASTRRIADVGQCRISDQGAYTVSRPVYSMLSTGLEVDRTGARNNQDTEPLAAESVWDVARASGLRVAGSSHLPWFRELFPGGFDRFVVWPSHHDDVFANADLVDVNLFHPLYVDEAGHQHGAAAPEYAAAVARADGEIGRLLDRLDLKRDLVILTSDHGHRDSGGHGGAQPELRFVLACFAGPNVPKLEGRRPLDGRSTGPALALLLGLRFPRHMRAGDDGLDAIWELSRDDAESRPYLADRRAAVTHFRAENQAALERWLGGPPGTWSRLYAREGDAQTRRLLAVGAIGLAVLAFRLRKGRRDAVVSAAWLGFATLAIWGAHHLVLGEFDSTVINVRERFVPRAFAIVFLAALVSVGAALALGRRRERLAADAITWVLLLLVANVGHVWIYGWPLGFPVPGAAARYLPFFGAIALIGDGLVGLLLLRLARTATNRPAIPARAHPPT